LAYKQIACIARFVPGIEIIGCGGISRPEHVIEAMMLGAKTIQIVTPALFQGREILRRNTNFLEKYMNQYGYTSLEDFRSIAIQNIKPGNEIRSRHDEKQLCACVDCVKCNGCGICADSICLAMSPENDCARVNVDKCVARGLCVAICPRGAVTLD